MQKLLIGLVLITLALLLTGCGSMPPAPVVSKDRLVFASPDERLRHCKARPPKPVLTNDADESMLIVDLDERGTDCASKLEDTWKSIDDAKSRSEKANAGVSSVGH